jgi:hypothetical protein
VPSQKLEVQGSAVLFGNGTSDVDVIMGISGYGSRLEYSTGKLFLRTNNSNRLTVDNGGNVGIGTSPDSPLHVVGTGGTGLRIGYTNNTNYFDANTQIFRSNNATTVYGQWDSSGRLLVGTSSSRALVIGGNSTNWAGRVQSSTTSTGTGIGFAAISWSDYATDLGGGSGTSDIVLARSNSNTEGTQAAVTNGMLLGRINFNGSDGTAFANGAYISAASDGQTWASGDCPGRLVFSTTADGASSPTERMRIKSSGIINFSNAPVYADNAAALAGGLVAGDVYRKADGTLMITF